MTEKTVGYFCGPTLAGIKPSNIVSCYKEQMPDIKEKIASWNEKLNEKGIYFEPLCECERRILLMVYRKDIMKKILEKTETAEFLKAYGYIDPKNWEACLCRLKQRISSCEFPHEIGVFLVRKGVARLMPCKTDKTKKRKFNNIEAYCVQVSNALRRRRKRTAYFFSICLLQKRNNETLAVGSKTG